MLNKKTQNPIGLFVFAKGQNDELFGITNYLKCIEKRSYWVKSSFATFHRFNQCDQMDRLFVQYSVI